jgi:hypothetical protein
MHCLPFLLWKYFLLLETRKMASPSESSPTAGPEGSEDVKLLPYSKYISLMSSWLSIANILKTGCDYLL